ncbi:MULTISPECIES: hypothetical protein [unclassified Nocardia]|uniref:hypothetical protein n=1 Tax=unclassified Nocardia TaxID=2637762 RepID=UPI00278C1A1F|nr:MULTISPECIES: hypothetical protein [unclassified Nocardia]
MTPEQRAEESAGYDWWVHEPRRLAADRNEIRRRFPALVWTSRDSGEWEGELPLWPFDRSRPPGLDNLLRGQGLRVLVQCGQAYPVVAPKLFALEPEPALHQRLLHRWHVNSDGSLCLLADPTRWTNRMSLGDLLQKAAGWRIEYELMVAGAVESMTANGIVSDDAIDHLISQAATGYRNDNDDC